MLRLFASAGLLLGLAGCAASPRPAAAPTMAGVQRGTIIAMRPVVPADSQRVRRLLRQLGVAEPMAGTMEFIVRTDDGATVAVVQPAEPGLRRGERVAIERGARTRIDGVSEVAVAR